MYDVGTPGQSLLLATFLHQLPEPVGPLTPIVQIGVDLFPWAAHHVSVRGFRTGIENAVDHRFGAADTARPARPGLARQPLYSPEAYITFQPQ
jgi:hypothetical protein